MIAHSAIRRRAVRSLLASVVLIVTGFASAQDPRAGMAQVAARDWLAKADKLDAEASYTAAGGKFKERLTLAQWSAAIAQVRTPLGDVSQRTIVETAFDKVKSDGGVDIEIVMLRFRTAFAKKADTTEVLTLEHEADGVWRVIGYEIR
jgi:hypothetical protein